MRNIFYVIGCFLTVLTVILTSCGRAGEDIEVWAEGALAVLGGTIMATQGEGRIAMQNPKIWDSPWDLLAPNAWAVNECPAITGGECWDNDLHLTFTKCRTSSMKNNGFRHGLFVIRFPSSGQCTTALSEGFSETLVDSLVGANVHRFIGGSNEESDQNNVRITDSQELAMNFTVFGSGWKEPKAGGIVVYYNSTTERRIVILGAQIINNIEDYRPDSTPLNLGEDTPVETVPFPFQYRMRIPWNHTINTPVTDELLFEYGPTVSFDGDLNPSFGDNASQVLSPRDGDAIIEGNTVQVGAMFKVQYNMSSSVGLHIVTEPLVYSDPLCCWPTSGKMRTVFDMNYRVPALWEEIVFQSSSCGAISYTSSEGEKTRNQLNHCF